MNIDTFVWAVGSLTQVNRLPFDAALLLQSYPAKDGAYDWQDLVAPLTALGLNAKLRIVSPAKLKAPCLLELKEDQLALLIKADTVNKVPTVWLFYLGATDAKQMPLADLIKDLQDPNAVRVIEGVPKVKPVSDPDMPSTEPFGFKWFVPLIMRHKSVWRDVLLASLVIQIIALATPLFTQVIIDKVVVHHTISTLVVIAVGLVIFMVFNAALTWVRQYLILHTGNRVDAELGNAVFNHLLRLPLRYFEHRPTGVIAARLHAVETIREFVASSLVTILLDTPFLLIFVATMFYYSVPLTLMVLVILAMITGLSIVVAPMFRDKLNEQFMLGARNQAFLTEYVAGLETVKSLQMESQLTQRYREYLATYLTAGFATKQVGNTYNVVAGMLEQLMTMLVLCMGAWIVMNGGLSAGGSLDASLEGQGETFTIGMLVAFQMFSSKLSQPMMRLVGLWQQFQQANISIKRLADIMDAPREPYALTPSRSTQMLGKIEIVNLTFRYGEDRPYLYQNLSLTLQPNKTTIMVGPSGSGKSTLAKLLQGFYQPTQGQIKIDGIDIRHLAANELRAYFGVVPQETNLFSGTILDNLMVANPQATFEQIVQASRMAEIHTTIEALPKGYQTEIGERGAGLSGGQKQRLAIARALLKRPKILIFDEATSALDSETAEHFAATINALRGKVGMLFITHAKPASLEVDEVVRIGGGLPTA
ncbi:MAG: peptidase domain-containing ABC transporter [Cytophagales bacterium]|nr:peptidase domain-containing ABC transporter [Cytophagales bacterium]